MTDKAYPRDVVLEAAARAEPYERDPDPDRRSIAQWDWLTIVTKERQAQAKGRRLPKCSICGRAMWLGQNESHVSCRPSEVPL